MGVGVRLAGNGLSEVQGFAGIPSGLAGGRGVGETYLSMTATTCWSC